MSSVEQSTEPSVSLEVFNKPEEPALQSTLAGIDALDLELGMCSRRVQRILNEVHNRTNQAKKTIQTSELHGEQPGPQESIEAFHLGPMYTEDKDWQLFATEEGPIGEVRQTIYFGKTNAKGGWNAVPVFLMLEKANKDSCSVSLCLPAASASDLDWAIVSTKRDEAKPITADESLKDIPQTNAVVLDSLINVLADSKEDTDINLIDVLHLEELYSRTFPSLNNIDISRFTKLEPKTRRSELVTKLSDLRDWGILSGRPARTTRGIEHGQMLRFTSSEETLATVERVITNLGTTPRITQLGHITLQAGEIEPIFVPNQEVASHFNPQATEEILAQAEVAYDIPEIITDPELTASINQLIIDLIANTKPSDHPAKFSDELRRILNKYHEGHGGHKALEHSVLNLGSINLKYLGPGDYIDVSTTGARLSMHINANSNQNVFSGDSYHRNTFYSLLYDCSVNGAASAFTEVKGFKLNAINCRKAFIDSEAIDSIAIGTEKAFIGGNATNCLAQSCGLAFSEIKVTSSAAIYCDEAFTKITDDSRNITAEYCGGGRKQLFTYSYNSPRFPGSIYYIDKEKRIKKEDRQARNMVEKNSTKRSVKNSYQAGKRFDPIPKA